QDLNFGWWYAGAGFDNKGTGDVVLGAREVNYANSSLVQTSPGSQVGKPCPQTFINYPPGNINVDCNQIHWYSMHTGGGNFCFADGSVRFLRSSANQWMPQISTRAGGEVFGDLDS